MPTKSSTDPWRLRGRTSVGERSVTPRVHHRRVLELAILFATFGLGLTNFTGRPAASAQPPEEGRFRRFERLRLAGNVSTAFMLSRDQRQWLAYQDPGIRLSLLPGFRISENFVLETNLALGIFPSSLGTGTAAELGLGPRVELPISARSTLTAAAHFNLAFTGSYRRAAFDSELGLSIRLSRSLSLGPTIGYGQIFHPNGAQYTTDARYISAGVALVFGPLPDLSEEPSAPEVEPERVTIVETREVLTGPPLEVYLRPVPAPPPSIAEVPLDTLLNESVVTTRHEQVLFPPVLFEHDTATPLPCGEVALYAVREMLLTVDDIVVIEGHADQSGDDHHNEELSLRRAHFVHDWLVRHGIPTARILVRAHGERQPLEDRQDEATIVNRRVTFHLEGHPIHAPDAGPSVGPRASCIPSEETGGQP